jgi:GT2 family glycosyltransferase
LFDERFFLYAEDKDLCWRLRRAGWRLVYLPRAQVMHHGGRSAAGCAISSLEQLQRSQLLFYHKHFSWPYAFGLSFTWWGAVLVRYLGAALLWSLCPRRRAGLANVVRHFRAANVWLLKHIWRPERL